MILAISIDAIEDEIEDEDEDDQPESIAARYLQTGKFGELKHKIKGTETLQIYKHLKQF